jgi:hypothetical protein
MKLLSDFDGVWTDPAREASAQGEILASTLLSFGPPEERSTWEEWLARARETVRSSPRIYGWAPGGRRLSAFADEDPFAAQSALLHYAAVRSADAADPIATAVLAGLEKRGFPNADALGAHTHAKGVEQVETERGPAILAEAADAGRRMLARGMEIVVVSNSTTDKLARWFGHASLPYTVHPERAPGAMRLRGGARKFVLDPARSETLELGSARIEVARPHYAAILEEERPDAVVGDVVSLDLALPLAWKRARPDWRDVRLWWLVRPYAPRWLEDEVRSAARGEIEPIDGGLEALPIFADGAR